MQDSSRSAYPRARTGRTGSSRILQVVRVLRLTIDPIQVALTVADALEGCGLRYLVGGSLASSLSGEPRSTLDVDLVVSISENDVQLFVDKLGDEFYAEPDALRRAIRDRSSANIIHYATSMKVDLFIVGGSVLDEQQMNRRQRVQVSTDPDRHLYFYTPEDILLQKLSWYRAGNEVSDQQWRDILGIVLVQSSLDDTYLRDGAEKLGVVDLLDRAILEGRSP